MPLVIKPHTAKVQAPRQLTTDKGEALPVGHVPEHHLVSCAIASISAEEAFRRFGVEQRESWRLMCEIEDAPLILLGALIYWDQGEIWLKVAAPVQCERANPLTQHAKVLLSRAVLREGVPQ